MTNSIRRARKFSRSGVAAASAVSLALGASSVVGPGPLASAAEEEAGEDTSLTGGNTPLTGGIRGADGSEVIDTGDQLASDLGAGSCVVASAEAGGSETGSQAGFSWDKLEPSTATTDKRTWGVSVAFDNSKDRTFASWEWNSSSLRTVPVKLGSVPAAPAGEPLGPDITASDQADEQLTINPGPQFTYGLPSDLTKEKVAQFAQAGAGSPVRYVWKDQYTKDNFTNPNLQATTNSNFIALVNPWPSENNECNPIKVDWVGIEQHVIEPGKDTKVGHITVPALSNGSVDDSLSRMVVEAYDGNGKYIASSHTAASGGGKQLLRVDGNGDIYFTWPEYRGTDLAAQQNVQFSVVAKPRTTGQLETANATDQWYGPEPKVFDSSNSLPRYSTANEIGRSSISLDDTEYHDPQYNTDEQTITSGIETDGSLTDQPQEVVFKQVPDLIRDLVKEKGNDGFEAKVVLDQRYVFEGWTAEMDPETYDVTVTSPSNPEPGTFAQPRVVVEYSNGSKDELSLLVIVDPNNTQVTELVEPDLVKGQPNTQMASEIGLKPMMKGYDPVSPAKFELDGPAPDGWTITVDEKTGKVTATADGSVPAGTVISPKVKATYPDQTTDVTEVQFQVMPQIKLPSYPSEVKRPGQKVTLDATVPDKGLSGSEEDKAPTKYTFEDGTTTYKKDGWTVTVDEETGQLTTQVPDNAKEGDLLEIPVLVHYDENTTPQKVTGSVSVVLNPNVPTYSVESTSPLQAVEHQVQDAPEGSTFSFGVGDDGEPILSQTTDDGWKYEINPDTGVVSSTPPKGAQLGDKKTTFVTVVYPDGSTPKVPVTTVVTKTNEYETNPIIPPETVYPGATVKSPLAIEKPENVKVAEENPYRIDPKAKNFTPTGKRNDFGNPIYTVKHTHGDWTVSLDSDGNVISTAPKTAEPGDQINVPVIVTYEDGTSNRANGVVNVVDLPEREKPFKVEYKYDDSIPAGEYRVDIDGKPGKEKMSLDEDGNKIWNESQAPVNEVVLIGTKLAESAKDVTWKVTIPYSTEVRENPDLAPGETKVVQEGENGEKSYTAKFTAKGSEAQVAEEEDTKEGKPRIIEYGPRLGADELVTTVKKPVPFQTKVIFDDTLAAGEQRVDQEGKLGEDTVTSTQTLVDGKPSGDPTVNTERTAEPTEQIIRVGTKTTGETVNSYEAEIPFPVRVVYDPNLAPGESKVTQEGKPGTKKVTITQKVVNSAADGEATVNEETVTEPTEQIVTVGTKPDQATNTTTWTAQVPYNTVVRPNPELKPGEVKTVQEGEYGAKKFTADFKSVGADATVTPTEEQTKAPKDQIIEYGPTIADSTQTATTTRPVEFETEFILDDTLPAGEQKVDQQGENGEEKITSTQEIKDGMPVGEPTITTEQTRAPKKAIIRVGTKPVTSTVPTTVPTTVLTTVPTTVKETVTTQVPTTVVSVTTAAGTPTTVTETKSVPTTYTTHVTTEVPTTVPTTVKETATSTVTPAPATTTVTEKPAPVTETVTVPFTTKIVWDPTLEPGQEIEDVAGVDGKVQVTVADGRSKVETVTNPVQRVVRVGSKPADGVEWTEETPFKVTVVLDAQLEAGKYETVQEGKPGRVIHRADGTEETTAATDHIIKVGTYKVITNPFEFTSVQPFGTTVRPNFKLEPGERKIVQEGKAGLVRYRIDIKTGEVVKLEDSAAVERIVEYGPDASDDKAVTTVTRPVPFDTEVIEDPNLPEGTQVIAQGEVGEEVVTTVQGLKDGRPFGDPITTTKQTVAPTNAVIRVGTKKPDAPQPLPDFERIVELPFTTKIVWDPTLEPGVEVEDVKGAAGQVKIQVVNGEPTVNTVKEPVQRVVRVGSKPADDVEWTEEIPFQVQVRQNPELTRGESRVVQDGVPGLKRYVNGKGEVVTEPVDYVFEIGTKDLVAELTYSPVTLRPGQTADVEPSTGHVEGNRYRKLEWPEGWEGSVDPDTGKLRVTPPADAKPGTKVKLPVEVTDADGNTSTVEMEVTVADGEAVPTPEDDKASSDKARRCLANAFAANSPFLWLLPLGILGAVGYGVNEAFGPQIQQLNARFDEAVRRNMPDFGVGHGVEKPEFVREIEGQVNAINQRFAPVAEQLQPVGIALGAIALLSLTGVLVAQACSEDGFDNGLTVLGSSKDDNTAESARSSKK